MYAIIFLTTSKGVMNMIDTTLLDSKEPISMEALQAFFQANDFSTMVSRYDAETATVEDNEFYLKVKKIQKACRAFLKERTNMAS